MISPFYQKLIDPCVNNLTSEIVEKKYFKISELAQIISRWQVNLQISLSLKEKKISDAIFIAANIIISLEENFLKISRVFQSIFSCCMTQEADNISDVIVAKDANNEIRAIMLLKEHYNHRKIPDGSIEISYLLTHPDNLLPGKSRIRGSALTLIAHVAKLCLQKQKGIYLKTLKTSHSFYLELGFTVFKPIPSYLHVSADKLNQLVNSKMCIPK
jgi:hypothetical protein